MKASETLCNDEELGAFKKLYQPVKVTVYRAIGLSINVSVTQNGTDVGYILYVI